VERHSGPGDSPHSALLLRNTWLRPKDFCRAAAEYSCAICPRTKRLGQTLECFTLALGGEAGARLARQMGILASGDTLIRQLRRRRQVVSTTPRILGVDDWAWRKGRRYGTILCDLERHRVIDLLPDRTADSLKEWLANHSGVAIISRDRASAYAEAAREAAPKAVQVADRWHLLRNLSDALQQILESKHTLLSQAAKVVAAQSQATAETNVHTEAESPPSPSRMDAISQAKRGRRLGRYESVMELVRQGVSQCEISRRLRVGRKTVRRWTRAGSFPERAGVIRRSSLDGFVDFMKHRYDQGCHNAAQLWCELRQQGFHGSKGVVRKWVHHLRAGPGSPRHSQRLAPAHLKITGSPRQTMWFFLQQPAHANDYLQELSRRSPELAAFALVAREFARIIRERDAQAWPEWLRSANTTALARFAASLCNDEAAVLAAMNLPWSNGQVEGQVHRLKLIKRQMYGRAKFDLLRLRVVQTA
jgi:transposase